MVTERRVRPVAGSLATVPLVLVAIASASPFTSSGGKRLVNIEPGPSVMMSAASIARIASGSGSQFSGSR